MRLNVSRLAFALLGALTLVTFGGPLALALVIRGGADPGWPPDRPVEWWTLGVIAALVVGLMIASIGVSVAHERAHKAAARDAREAGGG